MMYNLQDQNFDEIRDQKRQYFVIFV